ncbi:unnamed protein product [Prunus armeniaca]
MGPYFVLLELLHFAFSYEPYPGFYKSVNAKIDADIAEWKIISNDLVSLLCKLMQLAQRNLVLLVQAQQKSTLAGVNQVLPVQLVAEESGSLPYCLHLHVLHAHCPEGLEGRQYWTSSLLCSLFDFNSDSVSFSLSSTLASRRATFE